MPFAAGRRTLCAQPFCSTLNDTYSHFVGILLLLFFSLQLPANFNKNDDLGKHLCAFHRSLLS